MFSYLRKFSSQSKNRIRGAVVSCFPLVEAACAMRVCVRSINVATRMFGGNICGETGFGATSTERCL